MNTLVNSPDRGVTSVASAADADRARALRAEATRDGKPEPQFTILVDGECPLCTKEARMMAWMDAGRGRLRIVDIAAPGFDPSVYGATMDQVMGHIHGVTPEGRVVVGMEVFRRSYSAVGWPFLLGWTRLPGVSWLADRAYHFFARKRLRFTGRSGACDTGRCKLP
jgi:predicted DCC family thiol-disulfide oxidoreductase YuxK